MVTKFVKPYENRIGLNLDLLKHCIVSLPGPQYFNILFIGNII